MVENSEHALVLRRIRDIWHQLGGTAPGRYDEREDVINTMYRSPEGIILETSEGHPVTLRTPEGSYQRIVVGDVSDDKVARFDDLIQQTMMVRIVRPYTPYHERQATPTLEAGPVYEILSIQQPGAA